MPPPPLEPVLPHPVPRYLSLRLLLGLNLFPLDSATHLLLPPPLLPSLPLCTLSLPRLRVRSVRRARPNPQGARPSTGPHLAVANTQVAHPLLTHQVLGIPYHCVCFTDKEAQATRVASQPGAG